MRITTSRSIHSLIAVAIAAGGAAAWTPFAAAQVAAPAPVPQPQPPTPPGRPPMGRDGDGPGRPRGGPMMAELERLKTSLVLSPSQAAAWDRAQQAMRPPADEREQMKIRRDRMAAMLDDPDFDPRKLAAEMDGADAERRARMVGMRDAWIAVYASLNPVQRGQVREFLRSRLSRHHGGPMGWAHRPDGDGGRPGMPPRPPMPR